MIRNGRALVFSFVIHAAIAAAAILALESFQNDKPGEKARMCIALSQFAQPVAKAPKPAPTPPEKQPELPKLKPKPKPVVKPKPVEKPIIKEKAPVTVPEEVAVAEPEIEPVETVAEERMPEPEMIETAAAEEVAPQPVPALSAGDQYLQEHLALITKLLQEHLYYPKMARKRGITGEVMVAFELLRNGEATRINVISGERMTLNDAAIKTIERLSGRFPKPSEPITLHVPIRYELQ